MREHIEHLLGALGLLGFALFISYFNTGAVVNVPAIQSALLPVDTEPVFDPAAFEGVTFSTTSIQHIFPYGIEAALTASSTPGPAIVIPTKPTVVVTPAAPKPAVPVTPVVTPPPSPQPAPVAPTTSPTTPVPAPSASVSASLKGSIVNILCTSRIPTLHGTSGSGVIIDSRGLILTVTHVAQMVVLSEYLGPDKVSCVVRMGDPARNAYTVRPVFVSEQWIKKNPTTLISSQPKGTGLYDYAVLAITGSAGSPLGSYPAMRVTTALPKTDDTVYLGTYGAQGLTSSEVRTALSPTLTTSTVKKFYAFTAGTGAEVMALSGNEAARHGSSGGAVADSDGRIVGIVTTSDTSGDYEDREIRSITIRYIYRDFENVTGKDFDGYFSNTSVTTLVNSYAPTVQTIGAFLADAIGVD